MQVEIIDRLDAFERLRPDWDRLYSGDASTSVFTSWGWLQGWFAVCPNSWLVLAARPGPDAHYAAFLPLSRRERGAAILPVRELVPGGFPVADHASLVGDPKQVEPALEAFARHLLADPNWDCLFLRELDDPRWYGLLQRLDLPAEELSPTPSPVIVLPTSWEEYLAKRIGRWARRDLRRTFRVIDSATNFSISHATADTFESHLEALLSLWRRRWQNEPETDENLRCFPELFRRCLETEILWLAVLWDDQRPVASLLAVLDRPRGSFCAYITGYHPDYAKLKAGKAMYAYAIRCAIEDGFSVFDFGRGGQEHKVLLGGESRHNRNFMVRRRRLRARTARRVASWRWRFRS